MAARVEGNSNSSLWAGTMNESTRNYSSFLLEVPGRGLEPLRIAPPDPKSGASANFATLACSYAYLVILAETLAQTCARAEECIAGRFAGARATLGRLVYGLCVAVCCAK